MAERELTAGMLAALGAGTLRPVLFTEVEYVNGDGTQAFLRLHTGIGQVSWNGQTWTGGGQMLGITPIKESRGLEAIGFSVRISGLPADKVSIALASMRKNRSGKVWLGFYEPDYVDFDFTDGRESIQAKVGAGVAPVTFTRSGATATRVKKLAAAERYLSLPGIAGSYASTPDSVANSVTAGRLRVRLKVAVNDWITGSTFTCFVSKWDDASNQRSWVFELTTTGTLKIHLSPAGDGTGATVPVSTVAVSFTDGTAHWVGVLVDLINNEVEFETSEDGVTWTQLGATVAAGVASLFDSNQPLQIGVFNAAVNGDPLAGKVYYAEVRSGIGGTVVAKFDPSSALPTDTTITASTGEVWTLNGAARVVGAEIEVVAADTPRFDYDPLTLECKGLPNEAARPTICLHSDAFSNAVWSSAGVSFVTNNIAPDGSLNATKIESTGGTAIVVQAIVVNATSMVYSIFAKKGSGTDQAAAFNVYNNTTATDLVAVGLDYDSGVLTQGIGSGATVERWHDGWYRIIMPVLSGITSGNSIGVYACFSGGSVPSGRYAYVWRAQVEPSASFATSPITATTTAAVTRNAETARCLDISGFFNQAEGTVVVEYSLNVELSAVGDTTNNQYTFAFNDDSLVNLIAHRKGNTTARSSALVYLAGVVQFDTDNGALVKDTVYRSAFAWKANDFAEFISTGDSETDSSGTLPTVSKLDFGTSTNGHQPLQGHLRRWTYFPRRLPNEDLQLLAAGGVEMAWGGLRLIADPYLLRRGRFDIAPITRDGDTMTIELRYEDRLVDLERPRERRYTHEDQQLRLAGDRGFEQVPELQDAADAWGEPGPLVMIPRPKQF